MKEEKLFICYASSDAFARETGISLLSFFDLNRDIQIDRVFILDFGIEPRNKQKLDTIALSFDRIIEYINAKEILENIQKQHNFHSFRGSLATYSRAFLDKLLPIYVNRVLYIDSDTIVNGSINELISYDMQNCCMAAVVAVGFYDGKHNDELNLISGNKCYYSCGIVLYDVKNWRSLNCFNKIIHTLEVKDLYPYADQTLINNSIPELLIKKLPIKYNYISHIYNRGWEKRQISQGKWYSETDITIAMNNPIIIHYPGSPINRPWFIECLSQRKGEYIKYRLISPWSQEPLTRIDMIKSNKTFQFGNWVHKQEMIQSSYLTIRIIWFVEKLGSNIKKVIKKMFKIIL